MAGQGRPPGNASTDTVVLSTLTASGLAGEIGDWPRDSRAESEGRGTRVRPGYFTGAKPQWQ
jgi:hypothetical protein